MSFDPSATRYRLGPWILFGVCSVVFFVAIGHMVQTTLAETITWIIVFRVVEMYVFLAAYAWICVILIRKESRATGQWLLRVTHSGGVMSEPMTHEYQFDSLELLERAWRTLYLRFRSTRTVTGTATAPDGTVRTLQLDPLQ